MLVLTRKIGESIDIGNDIKITVVQIKGKQVRIGLDAPKDTRINRSELLLRNDKNSEENIDNDKISDNM